MRNQRDRVLEKLAVKNFGEPELVDEIIALDDERKKLTFEFDETKAKVNAASKEIGQLMAKGQKAEAEEKKKSVEQFKQALAPIEQQLAAIEKKTGSAAGAPAQPARRPGAAGQNARRQ